MTAFGLRFDDPGLEQRFLREFDEIRRDAVQPGFGFLVLLFGCVAAAQVYFAQAPLLTNLVYAGLGLVALFAFSFCRPSAIRLPERLHRVLAASIMGGAVLAVFAPGGLAALQLMAAVTGLMWFGLLSGLSPSWIRRVLTLGVVPVLAAATVLCWLIAPSYAALLGGLVLAAGFAGLTVYVYERRARQQFLRQRQPLQAPEPAVQQREQDSAPRLIRPDQSLRLLKELTIELSALSEGDAFYACLLRYFQRAVNHDLAAVGRLRNHRMMPVLMRTPSGDGGDSEDSIKMLWRNHLIEQLRRKRAPLVSDAEMGLLESAVQADEISFGRRLDIPFFSQGKLDGVVTLLRSRPEFSDAEVALAAGMVFHGLFAHRSARLQQQLEKVQQRHRNGAAAGSAKKTSPNKPVNDALLPVDDFLRRANDAFEAARADGRPVSLLLIEIDHHEQLLERYGANTGARVYEAIARLVVDHRVSGAIVGRYGAGSLAMQLPLPLDSAKAIAEQLRSAIRWQPLRVGTNRLDVTVSVGVSDRDSAADFLSLLRGADIGLYLARDAQGDSVRVHH